MGLRWRIDGRLICAAMSDAEPGDTYFDDAQMESMSRAGIIIPDRDHFTNGLWHWAAHLMPWWARDGELSQTRDEHSKRVAEIRCDLWEQVRRAKAKEKRSTTDATFWERFLEKHFSP